MIDAADIHHARVSSDVMSDAYRSVEILRNRPVATRQRDVSFYYLQDGQRMRRNLTIGDPVAFDGLSVAITDGEAVPPRRRELWQPSLQGTARFASDRLRAVEAKLSPPLRMELPTLDLREIEPNNIAHLLMSALPLSLYAQKLLRGQVTSIFRKTGRPFRELIDAVGANAIFSSKRVTGRTISVRGLFRLSAHDLLRFPESHAITMLPDIYDHLKFDGSWTPERIFIARRGTRTLNNQQEVQRLLARRGYEMIFMEDYPIPEQLAIASHAKHVVAVHSASMATLIMNPGLESVIELLPPNVYHDYYAVCLNGRVRQYAMLMPHFDMRIQHCDWSKILAHKTDSFTADLHSLEQALDEVGPPAP